MKEFIVQREIFLWAAMKMTVFCFVLSFDLVLTMIIGNGRWILFYIDQTNNSNSPSECQCNLAQTLSVTEKSNLRNERFSLTSEKHSSTVDYCMIYNTFYFHNLLCLLNLKFNLLLTPNKMVFNTLKLAQIQQTKKSMKQLTLQTKMLNLLISQLQKKVHAIISKQN